MVLVALAPMIGREPCQHKTRNIVSCHLECRYAVYSIVDTLDTVQDLFSQLQHVGGAGWLNTCVRSLHYTAPPSQLRVELELSPIVIRIVIVTLPFDNYDVIGYD